MFLIPTIATPVKTLVFRSVLDGRSTEHPSRPSRGGSSLILGGSPRLCCQLGGLDPCCIWRDPPQPQHSGRGRVVGCSRRSCSLISHLAEL